MSAATKSQIRIISLKSNKGIDIVILPSLWAETFGFNGFEALVYGKTVFASAYLGRKDLLPEEYIFSNIEELPDLL